jgi:branched-chain amino acid transport system substrate-binding protein
VPGYFREWDHQFINRLVMSQVRETVTDKYDPVRIVGKPMSRIELEALYGTKEEIGCTLGSV